ncbi:hypothetical protein PGUG_01123 [Meyerozyma guilliermondii ATCC 6260]|uniref:Small ribosomal subunit protein bS18m n=1 Tax=Meyerozyma guilliermondii (strain ATCC 6260 / CBS 566 / DSM 6381 / JCM 1539 / NBRC 10279 / NRRL Y-324) TaxID=294746 RepID=A5DCW8_PICGU|nr:uncharacterized protein PGUG_01123 [Meyerozyma guilliermondii ATCC 6260]EDK37025.1 hypothetical protein PGUG_01123 [Meyerozyma guilliermondii ATCC 6260]
MNKTMLRRTVAGAIRAPSLVARSFTNSAITMAENPLPSSPEMKSESAWTKDTTSNSSSVVSQVVGLARTIQESSQPPVHIDTMFTKRFGVGETYDPFDFSNDKLDIQKRERRSARASGTSRDPFENAGIDPLDVYMMPELLSRFLSSTGQILPREITGCNNKNQRKLSMAIKRARACGLLSSVHRHARFLPTRNM